MRTSGPVPLYYQVLEVLRERIVSGAYPPSGQLPTDDALLREFQVSRHTVRVAMQQMVIEGLIERFAGRGTFVIRPGGRGSKWMIGSIEDLIETSALHPLKVVMARTVRGRSAPTVATIFQVNEDDLLFHVRAVRSSEEGPYAYSSIYFPREIGEKLPRHLFTKSPFILLVEEFAGVPAYRAQQVALAARAERDAARLLKIKVGDPVLVMERTYFGRENQPIEHTRIQYRPERYQQTVNFWRRRDLVYTSPWEGRDLKGRTSLSELPPPVGGQVIHTN